MLTVGLPAQILGTVARSRPDLRTLVEEVTGRPYQPADTGPDARIRHILNHRHEFSLYPQLADKILRDYAGYDLVFIARDALPILHATRILAAHRNQELCAGSIAINRRMLPEPLTASVSKIPGSWCAARRYAARKDIIAQYLKQHHGTATLLHRYIRQELGKRGRVVLIESGFWGTVPLYVTEYLKHKRHKPLVVEHLMAIGPPGAPSLVHQEHANQATVSLEHTFTWPYENERLAKASSGEIQPVEVLDSRPHAQEWYNAELLGIEKLTKQFIEICEPDEPDEPHAQKP